MKNFHLIDLLIVNYFKLRTARLQAGCDYQLVVRILGDPLLRFGMTLAIN